MEIWTSNKDNADEQEEELYSLVYGKTKQEPVNKNSTPADSQIKNTTSEAITALGGGYEIRNIPLKQSMSQASPYSASADKKNFPAWLIAVIIAIPIILLFTLSAVSMKKEKEGKDNPFLFRTIESKYFTLTYGAEYSAESSIDKKVPFLEKHTITTPSGGDKTLSIMIKDVRFDYSLDENTAVKARRENSAIYKEFPYTFNNKQGLYFQKLEGNYESLVVFIDRSKSLLYEIMFFSPSNFAQSQELENEFKGFLDNMTLL